MMTDPREALVARYEPLARQVARRVAPGYAEEVLSDALLSLLRASERYSALDGPLVKRALWCGCLSGLQRERRGRAVDPLDDLALERLEARRPEADGRVLRRADAVALQDALALLPTRWQALLHRRMLDEPMTPTERVALHAARERLRELLATSGRPVPPAEPAPPSPVRHDSAERRIWRALCGGEASVVSLALATDCLPATVDRCLRRWSSAGRAERVTRTTWRAAA